MAMLDPQPALGSRERDHNTKVYCPMELRTHVQRSLKKVSHQHSSIRGIQCSRGMGGRKDRIVWLDGEGLVSFTLLDRIGAKYE